MSSGKIINAEPRNLIQLYLSGFAVLLFLLLSAAAGPGLFSRNKPEDSSKKEIPAPKTDDEKRAEGLRNMNRDITYGSTRIRIEAIGRVSKLRDEEKPEFLILVKKTAEEDRDPLVRKAAVAELRELKAADSSEIFIKALGDSSEDVQKESIRAVSELKVKEAAPHLLEIIKMRDFKTNDQLLIAAINTLGKLEYSQDWEFFKEKADDPFTDAEVRQFTLLYFGKVKAAGAAPFLLETAMKKSASVSDRAYAVNSLGHLDYRTAVPDLKQILNEIEEMPAGQEKIFMVPLRMQLLTALVRLGDESVQALLTAAAMDDSDGLRLRAVRQMGEMRLVSQKELLQYMSERDPHPRVRKEAKKALELLEGKADAGAEDASESEGAPD